MKKLTKAAALIHIKRGATLHINEAGEAYLMTAQTPARRYRDVHHIHAASMRSLLRDGHEVQIA